jgi:short-subunit dehydrogenase
MDRYGVRADYVQADLCQLAGVEFLWLQVLQLYPDGIDILINNAGMLNHSHFATYRTIMSFPN